MSTPNRSIQVTNDQCRISKLKIAKTASWYHEWFVMLAILLLALQGRADNFLELTQIFKELPKILQTQQQAEACSKKQTLTKTPVWQIEGCGDVAQQMCLSLSLKAAQQKSLTSSDHELQKYCDQENRKRTHSKLSARQMQDPNLEPTSENFEASGLASVNSNRRERLRSSLLYLRQKHLAREPISGQKNPAEK